MTETSNLTYDAWKEYLKNDKEVNRRITKEIEEIFISLLLERLFVKPIPWGIILLFKKVLKGNI